MTADRSHSTMRQAEVRNALDQTDRVLLGPRASFDLDNDPKHFMFVLARYKFVAKMLAGRGHVLEIGCGDGLGAPLVAAEDNQVTGIDIEPVGIEQPTETPRSAARVRLAVHDMVGGPYPADPPFDAAFSLDVIEHIEPDLEATFLGNIVASLKQSAPLIIGTPNKSAEAYASPQARRQHINLHAHDSLRAALGRFYDNVFLFGMNDEVVHTGYAPMCHYIFALAVQPRSKG